jgi:hypothetical protein
MAGPPVVPPDLDTCFTSRSACGAPQTDRLMVLLSAADSRYAVRALVFRDLDAVDVVRRDRRIPNAIFFRRSQDQQARRAEIEHCRAFFAGSKHRGIR